jgi:hypothetical protein
MRWIVRIPVSIVIIGTLGCSPSHPTRPTEATAADTQQRAAGLTVTEGHIASAIRSSAAIDGFRVHPDPDVNGVIHVFEGENVAVNAADIASRPPASQSYLVVNWGDGANQRVGCGPCRLEHGYRAGRYTLQTTADDLQPTTPSGSSTNRSISLVVEVSRQREPTPRESTPLETNHSLFTRFGFEPSTIGVGGSGLLFLPIYPPPPRFRTLTYASPLPDCTPLFAVNPLSFRTPVVVPEAIGVQFTANLPGTCTVRVFGTDATGAYFSETATLTIQ